MEGRGGEQRRVEELRGEEREERRGEGGEGSRGDERREEGRGENTLICSHVLPLPSPLCACYARLHLRTAKACSTCTER